MNSHACLYPKNREMRTWGLAKRFFSSLKGKFLNEDSNLQPSTKLANCQSHSSLAAMRTTAMRREWQAPKRRRDWWSRNPRAGDTRTCTAMTATTLLRTRRLRRRRRAQCWTRCWKRGSVSQDQRFGHIFKSF